MGRGMVTSHPTTSQPIDLRVLAHHIIFCSLNGKVSPFLSFVIHPGFGVMFGLMVNFFAGVTFCGIARYSLSVGYDAGNSRRQQSLARPGPVLIVVLVVVVILTPDPQDNIGILKLYRTGLPSAGVYRSRSILVHHPPLFPSLPLGGGRGARCHCRILVS